MGFDMAAIRRACTNPTTVERIESTLDGRQQEECMRCPHPCIYRAAVLDGSIAACPRNQVDPDEEPTVEDTLDPEPPPATCPGCGGETAWRGLECRGCR
jgi:hypothetical protein